MKLLALIRRAFPIHSEHVPERVAVNPAQSPPAKDWRTYDAPTWQREGKPHPLRVREQQSELPALLRRQAI